MEELETENEKLKANLHNRKMAFKKAMILTTEQSEHIKKLETDYVIL